MSAEAKEQIWKERCAYADALGFCIGALQGIESQMEPGALRQKVGEALQEARVKQKAAMEGTNE